MHRPSSFDFPLPSGSIATLHLGSESNRRAVARLADALGYFSARDFCFHTMYLRQPLAFVKRLSFLWLTHSVYRSGASVR